MRRWLLPALLLAAGCATVKASRIAPDFATADRLTVKRLAVVTAPYPEGNQKAAELWSLMARRYVNQKRDFIVKGDRTAAPAAAQKFDPRSACAPGLDGVLWLDPQVRPAGAQLDEAVDAELIRCSDGGEVWSAKASGAWNVHDDKLTDLVQSYDAQLGAQIDPFVAPAFHLLTSTLDTLPNPVLNDQDQDEKIELGD